MWPISLFKIFNFDKIRRKTNKRYLRKMVKEIKEKKRKWCNQKIIQNLFMNKNYKG